MSTGPVAQQTRTAASDTAGTAKAEAAQTAGTVKDAATQTASTAGQEVSHVAAQAQSAASDVVGTTKEQVSNVAGEAMDQVRDLTDQVKSQLSEQAGKAAAQLAQAVRSLAEELRQMSDHQGDAHGAASQAAHTLSERGQAFADYLEGREPEALVADLRQSAARKPGGFLFGAVLAGALAGRLVKGGRAAADNGLTSTPKPVSAPRSVTAGPVITSTSTVPASPVQVSAAGYGSTERPYADPVVEDLTSDGSTRWLS